jgi:hypothetical protein
MLPSASALPFVPDDLWAVFKPLLVVSPTFQVILLAFSLQITNTNGHTFDSQTKHELLENQYCLHRRI